LNPTNDFAKSSTIRSTSPRTLLLQRMLTIVPQDEALLLVTVAGLHLLALIAVLLGFLVWRHW